MIYGATGYTGRMLAARAVAKGLDPIVAGRDSVKVEALAQRLGLESRCFAVDDAAALRAGLSGAGCVLNVAGPFSETAARVIAACIALRTHYLDTTGEVDVFAHAAARDADARAAGIMLMPGVGWDVVPSDCIALHTALRVQRPRRLRIVLCHLNGQPSRGTLRTGLAMQGKGVCVRRGGQLLQLTEEQPVREFDFGAGIGKRRCAILSMGDLVTAWKSTAIPDIEVHMATGPRLTLPDGGIDAFPEGPTPAQLAAWRAFVLAEVAGDDGEVARSLIETGSGYEYTAHAGIEIARRALAGDCKPGFQSPASAYGAALATGIGAVIRDLD
ncbi:saccharopine dehydrogenase NADP-binding domain-containing protein [Hydrocarboniphaga sp.]|uniref:saccharopine dehydrogenase family protein n=1 Tax=Hydrocarboniphaga sp. TaxID=2033016 RepID=UPI0026098A56|nr:saccharopine dehydrogenase NADP-binding domain-containing protein [Hydrocarboniphaga sp.]